MSIASPNCWSTKTATRRIVQGHGWLKNNHGVISSPTISAQPRWLFNIAC